MSDTFEEEYRFVDGRYGLLDDGCIVKIENYTRDREVQEVFFFYHRRLEWCTFDKFIAFSNSKRELKEIRRDAK